MGSEWREGVQISILPTTLCTLVVIFDRTLKMMHGFGLPIAPTGREFQGADLLGVVCHCKDPSSDQPADAIVILLVAIADIEANPPGASQILRHVPTTGQTACSGPDIKHTNLRVPSKNLLCPPGAGAPIDTAVFDMTACLIGAMGVAVMHAAFDAALAFANSHNRRGVVDLPTRQAPAELLINIKMQTKACRALT